MRDALERLAREFKGAIDAAGDDPAAVEAIRVRLLGRKGELTALCHWRLLRWGALQPAGRQGRDGLHLWSLLVALVGAVVLLAIVRARRR